MNMLDQSVKKRLPFWRRKVTLANISISGFGFALFLAASSRPDNLLVNLDPFEPPLGPSLTWDVSSSSTETVSLLFFF